MSYAEDFQHILEKRGKVKNATLYVFKNTKPGAMKVFPEEVSTVLLDKYFETLTVAVRENEFVTFIPDSVEKGTLQVIETSHLTLWPGMAQAVSEMSLVDRAEITVDDYDCDGNTILMDIEFN